jgi:hypothetical protein
MGFSSFKSYGSRVAISKIIAVLPPTDLIVTETGIGMENASMTFTSSTNASNYNVYSSLDGGNYIIASFTISGNTASITGLTGGKLYKFVMTAFTATYSSPYSTPSNSILLSEASTQITPLTSLFNSNNNTISGNTGQFAYQNGSYTVLSSSDFDNNWLPFNAFNDTKTGFGNWISNYRINPYDGNTGEYTGSTSTTANNTQILGEWIQIVLPYSLTLTSYQSKAKNAYYLATSWTIVGSNDGTTWSILDTRNNSKSYWTSLANNTIVTFNSVSNIKYNTFRMIVRKGTGAGGIGVAGLNYFGYIV